MENKRVLEILNMELPCYDDCPCTSRVRCEDCEFQKAVDAGIEAIKKVETVEKALDEILGLSEHDCFEEYQFGFRAGLWKAYEVLKKAVEK